MDLSENIKNDEYHKNSKQADGTAQSAGAKQPAKHEKSKSSKSAAKLKNSAAIIIMKRELSSYFTSPIAYIVTGLFLVFSGFIFFSTFFIARRAELRDFFAILPVMFSFFIPALTMRLFSEEKRSGSLETLLTLPVTDFDVVMGKFLAAFLASAAMLAPSIFYVITACIFGSPDMGPIIGGYLGALFLCAAFSSIGIFASSLTKNQIIAFFAAFAICILFSMITVFLVILPAPAVNFLSFFSANTHFNSIARGIIDTRDLLYFISLTALFVGMTVKASKNSRR
ncbi:ABC transporter permease subunit [Treponema parvum]|uniref:ABC transporter permease subunit n=1 Tax=Treponema parvum TaxID=138851 RepID=UPI001AEC27B8|nr:ABC transporter permease subunit [Treponema parvum]QTQ15620.1 ABC transporter permease subunit [Treponema parvum]